MALLVCRTNDGSSESCLAVDGWRHIAQFNLYGVGCAGYWEDLTGMENFKSSPPVEDILAIHDSVEWRGRLFLDKKVENPLEQSRDYTRRLLKDGPVRVGYKNGRIAGYAIVRDDRIISIASVEKGMGNKLLRYIITYTDGQLLASTWAGNKKAIRMYLNAGFFKLSSEQVYHK